jgi:hypothetical protein
MLLRSLLILIFLNTGFSFAIVIFQTDFSSDEFPPPGWTIENSNAYGNWTRSTYGQPTNPYAKGQVSISTGPANGSTTLVTDYFSANEGDILEVSFIGVRTWTKPEYTFYPMSWYIRLRLDSTDVWSQSLSATPYGWTPTSVLIPITVSASTYRFTWYVWGLVPDTIYGGCSFLFYLDDVLIVRTADSVEPASVGRVKSFYK